MEGGVGGIERAQRTLRGVNMLLSKGGYVQICRMHHSSANPNVNYGLWVILMCQHRLINGDKCTTWVGNADSGGDYIYMWGHGISGTSLCSS